jgi:uncharacterized surface protein with fasciclin (FAS1) repeats
VPLRAPARKVDFLQVKRLAGTHSSVNTTSARHVFLYGQYGLIVETAHDAPVGGAGWNAPSNSPSKETDMYRITRVLTTALLLAGALAVAPLRAQDKDIVDTAVGAGQFKTLAAALTAAGLVDTLKGSGPFTVFAPTDEAFAKLPAGTVETLLKPENKAKLVSILTYHVVSGKVMAAQVMKMSSAKTVQGTDVMVAASGGTVTVNNARVVKADIPASNGVIHVIDTVIMPK